MYSRIRELLLLLKAQDDELSKRLKEKLGRYSGYPEALENLHMENAEKLNDIVENYSWPGRSKVGERAAEAAVSIALNAISRPDLQKKFLLCIEDAVECGDALPIHSAKLMDRILYNQGKPQKYGFLFEWDKTGDLVCNVEDEFLADERRKELGIGSIRQALQEHKQQLLEEGSGPPQNYAKHKQLEITWARKVGWR